MCLFNFWRIVYLTVAVFATISGVLFFGTGVAALAAGTESYSQAPFSATYETIKASLYVIFGIFIVLMSLGGSKIIERKPDGLTSTYIIIFLFLLIAIIVFSSTVYIIDGTEKQMDIARKFNEKSFSNKIVNQDLINEIQTEAECCGYEGAEYWEFQIPSSCYSDTSEIWKEGCKEKYIVQLFYRRKLFGIFSLVAGISLLFCLVSMIFAAKSYASYAPIFTQEYMDRVRNARGTGDVSGIFDLFG